MLIPPDCMIEYGVLYQYSICPDRSAVANRCLDLWKGEVNRFNMGGNWNQWKADQHNTQKSSTI